ncbi:MAG: ATP-binding cassette domain-containing protein [Oscillospiraceae bacterium]|nr:ATP-binding cassette domain-containing protein [Oscillospiraceae bacterium]
MERVSCVEQGAVQLDGFNLSILTGEIMGLLPVNNHGLSALIKILQSNMPLSRGYVYYREKQVNTWRHSKPRDNRIGLIQSEECLVEGLTVADNIFVLHPQYKKWMVNPPNMRKQLSPFLESINVFISADTYVDELSVFEKIVVDVLKSVVAGCRLIVLQDISAKVGEAELKKLHELLRYYAKQGITFIYIDFHLKELWRICDKVALMSNGRILKVLHSESESPNFGYTGSYNGSRGPSPVVPAKGGRGFAFEAKKLSGEFIKDLSFTAAAGECVTLQHMDIMAFREFLSFLIGESVPQSGEIRIDGKKTDCLFGGGFAVIQELPTETMLFYEMSYLDNLCFLLDRRLPEIWRSAAAREGVRREYSRILGGDVFNKRVDALSKIEKYELVYTRVAIQKPKVAFCVQPFRRADMELRTRILELIKMLLDKEITVVLLAANLADSLSISDKLIRIRKDGPDEVYLRDEFLAVESS